MDVDPVEQRVGACPEPVEGMRFCSRATTDGEQVQFFSESPW